MSEARRVQDSSGAVLLCGHIASGARPVLRGRRDKPVSPEDSGWQFRCNLTANEATDATEIWSVNEILARDDSLRSIIGEPYGTIVERKDPRSRWVVSRFDPDVEE